MALTRTIYTQGYVSIIPVTAGVDYGASLSGAAITGAAGIQLSGVQSANFNANSPKQDVSSFGVFGTIDKVQVEPSTATMELSMIITNQVSSGWVDALIADSQLPTPSGWNVRVSGVGAVNNAVLTAFRMEAAVGALPTINLTFDGVSGSYPIAPNQNPSFSTVTVGVATPDTVSGIYWNDIQPNALGTGLGCPQSIRVAWEMPVERLNCLGSPIDQPTVFTRPPGTLQFVVEGIDYRLLNHYATGVVIGKYSVFQSNMREVARTVNMSVGESAATYNVTSENVAMGAQVHATA